MHRRRAPGVVRVAPGPRAGRIGVHCGRSPGHLAILEREHRGQRERYLDWVATILATAAERHGRDGLRLLTTRTLAFFAAYPGVDPVRDEVPAPMADDVAAAVARGDTGGALALFDDREAAWRSRHRRAARLAVRAAVAGARQLRPGRAGGVPPPPRRGRPAWPHARHRPARGRAPGEPRAPAAGPLLRPPLEEDDEKFTIVQDPCGTCARQITDGRLDRRLDLAVVDDPHAATWFGRPTRPLPHHVPIWHVDMARERLGVPWPVNLARPVSTPDPARSCSTRIRATRPP